MGISNDQQGAFVPGLPTQQVSNNPAINRTRIIGLMPTDGQDAYKRSPSRASRRSRPERASYLVATGHLDPEETKQLNQQPTSYLDSNQYHSESPPTTIQMSTTSDRATKNDRRSLGEHKISSNSSQVISNKRSNFEPTFLDDLNRTLANSPTVVGNMQHRQSYELQQEELFESGPKKKQSRKNKKHISLHKSGRGDDDHETESDSRGKFKQSYTEVTLPMKTSPAFEYILKDNERRNKRCCLWFLYSTLVSICIAIILFCSIHLVLRAQSTS